VLRISISGGPARARNLGRDSRGDISFFVDLMYPCPDALNQIANADVSQTWQLLSDLMMTYRARLISYRSTEPASPLCSPDSKRRGVNLLGCLRSDST